MAGFTGLVWLVLVEVESGSILYIEWQTQGINGMVLSGIRWWRPVTSRSPAMTARRCSRGTTTTSCSTTSTAGRRDENLIGDYVEIRRKKAR